ncbi:MAG: OmpA family protein [Candidatus Kapaibacterium sp.]
MKNLFVFITLSIATATYVGCGSLAKSITDTVENTATGKVDQKAGEVTSNTMDTMLGNGQHNTAPQNTSGGSNSNGSNSSAGTAPPPQSVAAYQNYDFKAGDTIIFSDDFTADQDGEFPAHWTLEKGQGVVNVVQGAPAFCLTEGNYVIVSPRMKTTSYLSDPFTVEFDYFSNSGYDPLIRFYDSKDDTHDLHFGHQVSTAGFPKDFDGSYVGSDEDYKGKWHHAAVIYKNGQMKAYLDNTRALVVPEVGFVPVSLKMGGIGDPDKPLTFKNVRIANGGNANTIASLMTNGKFVTHGITFDVGKATLRPESMGTLNDVAKYLKANSDASFEIDGYTDNDGSAAANLKLSQARADAVKSQLVTMGVDGSLLTTKGYGASKPIASNDTPEGKANNRRVEFVKM